MIYYIIHLQIMANWHILRRRSSIMPYIGIIGKLCRTILIHEIYVSHDFYGSYSWFNDIGAKYTQVNAVNDQHILEIYKKYLKWLFKEIQLQNGVKILTLLIEIYFLFLKPIFRTESQLRDFIYTPKEEEFSVLTDIYFSRTYRYIYTMNCTQ